MKKRSDLIMPPKKIPKLLFRAFLDAVILFLDNLGKEKDPFEKQKKY